MQDHSTTSTLQVPFSTLLHHERQLERTAFCLSHLLLDSFATACSKNDTSD